jgi:hypothetical protein
VWYDIYATVVVLSIGVVYKYPGSTLARYRYFAGVRDQSLQSASIASSEGFCQKGAISTFNQSSRII